MNRDPRPIHLLLIEDNPGDALLVEEYLSEVFIMPDLTHVKSFIEARQALLTEGDYDAVFLDLTLPDSDGIKLVDNILELAGTTPVVILTGYTNLDFSMKSLSKGVSDYLIKDELSPTLLYKSIVYSIERNAYSAKLIESEKHYRDLFELSPQPMWLFDLNTLKFLDVNRAAINHYGYTKDEFLSMNLKDIRPADDHGLVDDSIRETKNAANIAQIGDIRHKKKDGSVIKVELNASNIQYKGKNARIVLVNDVTEKRKEEERLKLLESVIVNTTESIIIIESKPSTTRRRKILYVNDAFTRMTGYERHEVLGQSIQFLNGPKTDPAELKKLKKAMKEWEICNAEFINYRKDGSTFWINTSLVPVVDKNGTYTHWVAIGRDISNQKKYEKQLQDSLAEKEVLLSEIHHRVKNNLAVVSGMMMLQAFEEENEEVEKKLQDSIMRIQTMATIHEILYESSSFSKVNFTRILDRLTSETKNAMQGSKKIDIEINKTPVHLNINQAIPCALMVNEVLTNSYKHAFTDRKKGRIKMDIRAENESVLVSIEDDGIGLPENFSVKPGNSLGMNLVRILTEQLRGSYTYTGSPAGTNFTIRFKKKNVKGSASADIM